VTLSPGILVPLQRHLGLAPESVGERAVAAAVDRRMAAVAAADRTDYEFRLATDPAELRALADAVVVHETWFFRYPESFRLLAGFAAGRRAVRALSVPCSTGEEAYSVAITLLDAGVAGVSVLGVDVSEPAVARARAGVYPEGSFRESTHSPAERHFIRSAAGRVVAPAVKGRVAFRVASLIDPFFLADEPPFDVILCRNLFIYLTRDARARGVANLTRLLAPDGVLLVGHAESFALAAGRFRPVGSANAFAFTRATTAPPLPPVPPPTTAPVPAAPKTVPPPPRPPGVVVPPPPPPAAPPDPLAEARAAADRGEFREAARLCERVIGQGEPSAEGFALLGSIRSAAGDAAGAVREFERAVYLDPRHYDALVNLMALAEARHDAKAAAHYCRRAAAAEGDR
jgi:chemotaxis protein methyltransferase WspC